VQRVLDIDLDFFVYDPVYWPPVDVRPDLDDHPVWSVDEAIAYLRGRCDLSVRLPGFVTENHGELFPLWRQALIDGRLRTPFHVTHLDAHADLGLGDAGYVYLLTELLLEEPENRWWPRMGFDGLNDGNHLAFAVACRWISDLVYVHGPGGGDDELAYVMRDFDPAASEIQLPLLTRVQIHDLQSQKSVVPERLEPAVPYHSIRSEAFETDRPFDFICLTRSPPFTPEAADELFDAIRESFIGPLFHT
jgi:hypothetical protein